MQEDFYVWFLARLKKRLGWLGALGIAETIAIVSQLGNMAYAPNLPTFIADNLRAIPSLLAAIMILTFILLRGPKPFMLEALPVQSKAARTFSKCWELVWFTLFLLYVTIFLEAVFAHPNSNSPNPWWIFSRNVINNIQTGTFALCYFALKEPVGASEGDLPRLSIIAALVASTAIEFLFLFFDVCNYAATCHVLFELAGGLVGGIALSLFISRLETRNVGSVTLVMAAFYFYAVLQPSYALFRMVNIPWFQEAVLILSLPLKALLFVFVFWFLTHGRILFYYTKALPLYDVNDEWKKFKAEHSLPSPLPLPDEKKS